MKKGQFKTWVEINKKALKRNIRQFQKLIGDKVRLMAVVKANAYGHGLVEVAKIVIKSGANWLGVDSVDEAIKLRKAGINASILIMGYTLLSRLEDVVKYNLRQVVYNKETVQGLALNNKKAKPLKIHLKIETNRNFAARAGERRSFKIGKAYKKISPD